MHEESSRQELSVLQYLAAIKRYIGKNSIMNIGHSCTEHQVPYVAAGCVEESLMIDFRHAKRPVESFVRPLMK
jgi:hypothetical protein